MKPKKKATNLTLSDFVYEVGIYSDEYVIRTIEGINRGDNEIHVNTKDRYTVKFGIDPLLNTCHISHYDDNTFYLNETDAISASINRHEERIKKLNDEIGKHRNRIEKLKAKLINQ